MMGEWWRTVDRHSTECIQQAEANEIGISIISCWEVAKLVEKGRLSLTLNVREWITRALSRPGVNLLDLTPDIVIDSTMLPGAFHSDPADQMIVATARMYDCPLLTSDKKISSYEHVTTVW